MRKGLIAVLLAMACLGARARAADEISVIRGGKDYQPLAAYRIGESYFLSAKDAGALYGGQVYWYPVSGRVQLSFRGRALQLLVDSDAVKVGSEEVKLESPVLLRASQAYIPLSFFLTEAFSA